MPAPKEIADLVSRFEMLDDECKLPHYKKADARREFMDPFSNRRQLYDLSLLTTSYGASWNEPHSFGQNESAIFPDLCRNCLSDTCLAAYIKDLNSYQTFYLKEL